MEFIIDKGEKMMIHSERNWRKTCLSILLAVVCFVTSLFYVTIDSNAQDEVVNSFYILDEEGNPVNIEITQRDIVEQQESSSISTFSLKRTRTVERAKTHDVVRFQDPYGNAGVVYYTEVDTGRNGYFNCYSAGDAALVRTESDGSIICKLSGVLMRVAAGYKKTTLSHTDSEYVSYYYVGDNGYLIHRFTYYNGASLACASTRVGYPPSFLKKNVKYYSYDAHYFYTDFTQMISDYQNNTYSHAINANSPYYNYYQYLSFHTTAPFTAEQYNAHVAAQTSKSVMLTTGNAFVKAQNDYTINALLLFGIAINESGWGTSPIAQTKNNLFGMNAVDSSPGESANTFSSVQQCINEYAYYWIHKGYMNGTDSRYRGPHLGDKHSGFNVKYASDPYWGEKAAARGYYLDTQKVDYGRHTIGIATSGNVQFYKEASTTSTKIYTSEAGEGSGTKAHLYDFPVTIIGEVTGSNGQKFYKVLSDMSLKDNRSARNVAATYKTSRDYVYVKASDVKMVFKNGSTVIAPDTSGQDKNQGDVLKTLNVVNTNGYLTGFALGSDVSVVLAKVSPLGSNVKVTVKKADGAQITSGRVATGMKMTIVTKSSTADYTIVIRGDVSGDGQLSAIDYVILRNHMDKVSSLQGAYLNGADTTKDGRVSAIDYVTLRNHLDKQGTIVQ